MPLDPATLATLRRWRGRDQPRDRRSVLLAVLAVLLLHVFFVLAIRQALQPPAVVASAPAPLEQALQVRFVTAVAPPPRQAAPPPPALPTRTPSAVRPPPRAKPREQPAKNAMTIDVHTKAAPPDLYNRNGEARLPPPASSAAPNYVSHALTGDTSIMQHANPVPYQPTRFAKDWDTGGGGITRVLQKAVDKTTVRHTFHLPGGIRIHCAAFLLAGGCTGDPPPPPSPKDGDERLNMAPAPLAPNPHPPEKPTVAACIAMYQAGKPLAYGCPVDTPNRAVDEDMRKLKARQKQR